MAAPSLLTSKNVNARHVANILLRHFPQAETARHVRRDYAIAGITFACVAASGLLEIRASVQMQQTLGMFAWLI
ncbi:MAG: hypothetical protein LDL14_09385, partial [Nitrospira sp.]|nr:hypothetical protein [Nitrospira sp.]